MSSMVDLWTVERKGYSIHVVDAYQGNPEDATDNDCPPLVLIDLSNFGTDFDINRLDRLLGDLQVAREVLAKALQQEQRDDHQ